MDLCCLATEWKKAQKTLDELDAIDTMLLTMQDGSKRELDHLDKFQHIEFEPFDPSTKRTMATVRDCQTGEEFRVAKGATKVILGMCDHPDEIRKQYEDDINAFGARGIRAIALSRTDDVRQDKDGNSTGWYVVGFLCFLDPARSDTAHVIAMAEQLGVTVKMITGDAREIAVEMCKTIGLPSQKVQAEEQALGRESPMILKGEGNLEELPIENLMRGKCADGIKGQGKTKYEQDENYFSTCTDIGTKYGDVCEEANGFAGVLPEHKFLIVESFRQNGHIVGMCGDGVNDAPALARADVGIAVEGATAAAQASADIVLTEPGLSTIVTALVVSRKIFTRMKNFVIYRVACTEQLLFFFLISCLAFNPQDYASQMPHCSTFPSDAQPAYCYNEAEWPDYFSLPVIALVTICILNDGTIISVAYDNVEASMKPEKWNLMIMYLIASVIGLVALCSSIVLLELGLRSSRGGEHGLCYLGIKQMSFGEIQTMMYLKISLSDYCCVFNSRCKSFFWTRAPSIIVVGAAFLAVTAATLFSAFWPFGSGLEGLEWDVILFTWAYVLVWSVIQDVCKVLNNKLLAYCGVIQNLGVVDESKLNFDTDGAGFGELVAELSGAENFGPRYDPTLRRRTSSLDPTAAKDSQLVDGFISAHPTTYDKRHRLSNVSPADVQTLHLNQEYDSSQDRTLSYEQEPHVHHLNCVHDDIESSITLEQGIEHSKEHPATSTPNYTPYAPSSKS